MLHFLHMKGILKLQVFNEKQPIESLKVTIKLLIK